MKVEAVAVAVSAGFAEGPDRKSGELRHIPLFPHNFPHDGRDVVGYYGGLREYSRPVYQYIRYG